MGFPADQLKPAGGRIYCHVFENPTAGIARDLFWSFTVDFEPVQYADSELACSTTCEWIRWPIRDWRQLEGQRLECNDLYEEELVEASFYVGHHDPAESVKLAITGRRQNHFHIAMSMVVEFEGYAGGDADPELAIQAEANAEFTGLIIVPDNLFPKPATVEEVAEVAGQYLDQATFEPPEPDRHRFLLRPRVAGP